MLIQAGIFGMGPNSSLNQWTGRDDVSVQLMWQLEDFGIRQPRADQEAAGQGVAGHHRILQDPGQGGGGREPGPGAASSRRRPGSSRPIAPLRTGIITFNGHIEGLEQTSRFGDVLVLISRPQEAVYALQLLNVAFDEYFTTVAEYNRAQFDLFHALGYPAREIAYLRPPGNIQPVNTMRPPFLPPVARARPRQPVDRDPRAPRRPSWLRHVGLGCDVLPCRRD